MDLFIIDAIGPFFKGYKADSINWSKIPFSNLEHKNGLDREKCEEVARDVDVFARKMARLGYNAVSIDDLAHMVVFEWYPDDLKNKIREYQFFYHRLFKKVRANKFKIFITTDVIFSNVFITEHLRKTNKTEVEFLAEALEKLYAAFPQIDGIIVRIGESDGIDVEGDFKSVLAIKTIEDARNLLKKSLQICEKHNKKLIVRTWTVGGYEIGDLMWNERTYEKVFDSIESDALIISMKYGECDFFRFLNANKLFFTDSKKKIIELQARREYELFGAFPSYIGWDYERIRDQVMGANIAGISVWCQTGGWSKTKDITFVENSSLWNELNTYACIKLFKDNWSASEAAKNFYSSNFKGNTDEFFEFLKKADKALVDILYIESFAKQRLFFRKVRIPPLSWIFWTQVLINGTTKKLFQLCSGQAFEMVRIAYDACNSLADLERVHENLHLPQHDWVFQRNTFRLLAHARARLLGLNIDLIFESSAYQKKHPQGLTVHLGDAGSLAAKAFLRMFIRRTESSVLNSLVDQLTPFVHRWSKSHMRTFPIQHGMPMSVIFR